MKLTTQLYRLARLSNDIDALTGGDADRIARRAKNKLLGRALSRAGVWRRLWR